VDVVKAPIDGDTSERTYFTGDGYPKKTDNTLMASGGTAYPMNAYKLGVPVPNTSVSHYTITGTPTNAEDVSTNAAWIITYVTAWGEEGGASDPIGVATFQPGQTYSLTDLPTAPVGNYNITTKRIYRSNTGNSGTAYQFEAEIPVSQATYTAAVANDALGETITTMGWEEPPEDGFGLTLGANGNAIILSGRTIHPAIPFILYAYPPEYQLSVESDLVGAGAFGQGFAILTKANPYLILGVDPASYSMIRLDTNQACISKRSIVEMMGGVVYASPDGLWFIDGSGLKPLTASMMTKEQWQAYKPENSHACELDGRYHFFYDTGTSTGSLIFDFGRTPYVTHSDIHCTAAYNDPLRDSMYMAQGVNITKWDAGAATTYTWKSKEYRSPWYCNYGYAKVEAKTYPVTFKLYTNGALLSTKTVLDNKPFRIAPNQTRSVSVEVTRHEHCRHQQV
jgi:hypothetical protein